MNTPSSDVVKELRDRFWEHRIPRNTKQEKDLTDWFISKLEQARKEERERAMKSMTLMLATSQGISEEEAEALLTEATQV